jgi:hypothetical protein
VSANIDFPAHDAMLESIAEHVTRAWAEIDAVGGIQTTAFTMRESAFIMREIATVERALTRLSQRLANMRSF